MQKLFAVELVLVFILFAKSDGTLPFPRPHSQERSACESLKCYVCRSDSDKGCNGHMNQSLSQECPAKGKGNASMYCRKISQKLRFRDENSWTSIRECAYEKGSKDCYNFKWLELAYQETCECSEDNCNRGINRSPNILTVTVTLTMWMFNYLKTDHT